MDVNKSRANEIRTQNGMNGQTNGRNGNMQGRVGGEMLRGDLAERIRPLCFVPVELDINLHTLPNCRIALDYYYRTLRELRRLTEQYENTVGPLTSAGVVSMDQWTWVKQPWPWQRRGDYMEPREGR